jgi:hypothetical protein
MKKQTSKWHRVDFMPLDFVHLDEETNLQMDAIQWHEINSVEDLWTAVKKVIQNYFANYQ